MQENTLDERAIRNNDDSIPAFGHKPDGVFIESPLASPLIPPVNGNYAPDDEDDEVEDDLILGDEDELEGDEEEYEVELEEDADVDDIDEDDLVLDADDEIDEDEDDEDL